MMISILIIEDDNGLCSEFTEIINNNPDLSLICITNDFSQALHELSDSHPDVILFDLELQNGCGNGIEFLQNIPQVILGNIPYIIVETRNTSTVTLKFARQLGVDFIFSKYEEDFSANKVTNFILSISDVIKRSTANTSLSLSNLNNLSLNDIRENILRSELKFLGIMPKLKGYNYLVDAILMLIENASCDYLTFIAGKYSKSASSIERAMQNAVKNAWTINDINVLNDHFPSGFPSNHTYPTLKEFIFYYVEYLKAPQVPEN